MLSVKPIEIEGGVISCPTCATKPVYYLEYTTKGLSEFYVSPLKYYMIYDSPEVTLTSSQESVTTYESPPVKSYVSQLVWPVLFGILFMLGWNLIQNYLSRK